MIIVVKTRIVNGILASLRKTKKAVTEKTFKHISALNRIWRTPAIVILSLLLFAPLLQANRPETLQSPTEYSPGPTESNDDGLNEFEELQRLASLGNKEAQYQLALRYLSDVQVQESYIKAINLLQASADQGYVEADDKLSMVRKYLENEPSLVSIYRRELKQAKTKDGASQYRLGQICEYGLGVERNHARSIYWYKKAARQAYPDAQNKLGEIYSNDIDLQGDSLKWIKLAARNGQSQSQLKMAKLHFEGGVLPKDKKEGLKWLKKSVAGNNHEAMHLMANYYMNKGRTEQNYAEALLLLEKAVDSGYLTAKQDLDLVNRTLDDLFLENYERHGLD